VEARITKEKHKTKNGTNTMKSFTKIITTRRPIGENFELPLKFCISFMIIFQGREERLSWIVFRIRYWRRGECSVNFNGVCNELIYDQKCVSLRLGGLRFVSIAPELEVSKIFGQMDGLD
jgi:hypothetical protein